MPRPLTFRPIVAALCAATALAQIPFQAPAQSLAGAYLAAREARINSDFAAASDYLQRIIDAAPDDAATLETAAVSAFSAGDFILAADRAQRLLQIEPRNRAGTLILLTDAFARGDHDTAFALSSGEVTVHPLMDGLAQAWARLGQGRMSEALDLLDAVSAQDGLMTFALYCRALSLALVGDVEGALAIIEDPAGGVANSLNRRGYIAYAQLLGLSERYGDALSLMDQVLNGAQDRRIERMRAAYAAGEAVPFDLITAPEQGMAEVFAVMANAMFSAQNLHEALIYAQAAVRVNPGLSDAQLMIGQIFEELHQPEMAAAAYARVPEDDVFGMAARLGRAQVLETLGQVEEAQTALLAMTQDYPDSFAAQQVLGDFYRRNTDYLKAVEAYSRAIEMIQAIGASPGWQVWFSRAVAYERTGQWDRAEADFRAALALEPDQPTVLNYLGYSLVERGEKLDEALDMIERAVAGDPDSGYVVDSLAWALFRLGRYEEALPHMERAVELEPTDAILNDHLGDVFWAMGRYREARFQWRRALSFGPSDDMDEARVRRKLEIGLDAVRAEEGLPPLHAPD
ncbi:MAG: tetratricopeptide repeat protein [Pararhodobacter sp.]